MSRKPYWTEPGHVLMSALAGAFLLTSITAVAEPYRPDGNGQVVMEAEHFDLNVGQGGRDWVADFTSGYVGDSAMQSVPNSFLKVSSDIAANSPRMDYAVEFTAPVTLNVWIRGLGLSGSRDSVWVGVDGDDTTVLLISPTRGAWGWETSTDQLAVPAGVHTINIWMREDGTIVDRLLLTPLTSVPTADGPAESPRGGGAPGNTAPVALDDSFTVDEDSSNNPLAVLADNGGGPDSDPDGDALTITAADSPGSAGGTVTINATSNGLLYAPVADFAGIESFDYTISDGRGGFSNATVTVTVNNANNDPPLLAPVGDRSTIEEQLLAFSVSASDADGAPLPVMSADLSQLPGTPGFIDNNNGTGSFSWTPALGVAPGPYSVTFTATDAVDGALTSTEVISIDVQAAGGGGSGAYQPDGNGQVVMEAEHFDLNVGQGGRDWVADFTSGYVGDSAMQSVPNSFLKVSSDIAANSPRMDYAVEFTAPVTLNVWIRGLGLSGSRDSVWVGVDGDDTTVLLISPTRGAWGWETSTDQLAVPAGVHTINIWMREDGTIVDRLLLTPLASVPTADGPAESPRGGGAPGNTAPVALDDSFTVDEDSSKQPVAVLADNGGGGPDSDPDGDALTITAADSPGSAGGTVTINATSNGLLYAPVADFAGIESFDYTISDGRGGFSNATVTVTVNNTNNDPPLLAPVGDRSTIEEQLLAFSVSASDADGAPLPVMSADLSQLPGTPGFIDNNNGTGSFSWTPALGVAPGPYSVTFTATDAVDGALTSTEVISIDVQAAGGGGSGAYQPDGNGQVVVEAEHFDLNVGQGGRDWVADFTPGYAGDSAMQSVPNSFLKVSSDIAANSPRMDYAVEFTAPVTLNVWIRGLGLSGSRDSVWVGVDGDDTTVLLISPTRGAWGWETSTDQLAVPAGVHTINIWMREDGTIVDRLLLTPLASVPTADGPTESPRGGGSGGSPLPLSDDFSDGIADGWTVVDDATQFQSDWAVANQAFVQSSWTNSAGKDVIETYHRGSYAYWTSSAGLSDYRLAVDVLPDTTSGDDIGVMFRYSDSENYYRFSLNVLNGFARLEEKLNGTFLTFASNHRGYRPGEVQNVVVEVEGPLIQVFVNGDQLFAAMNSDHSTGGIALYSRDKSTFDNVLLTANGTDPEIIISRPTAHNVLPGEPLDLDVSAIARNVPAPDGSVRFQYHDGGGPIFCGVAAEGPSGHFTAQCPGMTVGDYTVEALLLDNGVEVDRDSNTSVAIGSTTSGSHRYDAIGNSITRGVGDNYSFDNLNLTDQRTIGISGWPALLGDLLSASTGAPSLVGNEGIPGDRASHTRDQRILSIIERNPESDRALIMLGTNDSNNFNTTPTAELIAAIQSVIDELRANGRDTVYLALLPPAWGRNTSTVYADPLDPSATRNQTIIDYNAAIRSMLPQAGVQLGPDFFSCFLTPTVNRFSLFEDSLHPNALGYAFMAALWEDAVLSGPVTPPVDPCPSPIFVLESLDPYLHGHKQNVLEKGDEYYTDEAVVLTNIPAELRDGIWVLQANADNGNTDLDFLNFSVAAQTVTVYIAFDPAGNPPTSSTHTFSPVTLSEDLTVSDAAVGAFSVVRATDVTGSVSIGGNNSGPAGATQQGYVVVVVAQP